MPTGWTAAQPASTDLTCVGTGCSLVTSSGPIEVGMGRSATGFTLAVQVTPPASVAVRDTGTRPALTVRIEPHAGATVTTIEEKRP